jgi:hypothetical protein
MAEPAPRQPQRRTSRVDDHASIQRALSLIGAWKDLDNEDRPDPLDELDRIRHESKPSPPLSLP